MGRTTQGRRAAPAGAAAIREAKALEAAYRSFWAYCRLMAPDFYREDRGHLRELCDTLQALYEGRLRTAGGKTCRRICISEPPRHGKSYTMSLFNQWVLGRDPKKRIINVSYNDILSTRFARTVRDGIGATKIDPAFHIFSDVFPGVRIKAGDGAMDLWSLEGSHFTFLAASFGSTVTGVGCDIMIIDDPIKDSREAMNDRILEEKWDYYRNTLRSRLEKDGLLIVVMTRWATKDLVGRIEAAYGDGVYILNQPACLDEGTGRMLCPDILSFEDWQELKRTLAPEIFLSNYQNTPIDRQGALYQGFSTTEGWTAAELAEWLSKGRRLCYIDTADTGADYLCGIAASVNAGEGLILDILYTDAPMERTEAQAAELIYRQRVSICVIESNNGGRGFRRNVERLLWERYSWRGTKFIDHAQRSNKEARILTQSSYIEQRLHYPPDWTRRWPGYAMAMQRYQRKGKNAHDDAPDATTGLAEAIQGGIRQRTRFVSGRGARR